jgi:hypothetical protein
MEFLGLDLIRSKIIVKHNYLQVKTLNISVAKFPMKMKRMKKPNKVCSNTGNFKQLFENKSGRKIFKNKSPQSCIRKRNLDP